MFEKTPDIMTFKECRQLLKVGKNTLLYLIHSGQIYAFKIGNRWKIQIGCDRISAAQIGRIYFFRIILCTI